MTDWLAKKKDCKHCRGFGYTNSEARHATGRGPAEAFRCSHCQPQTMDEMAEAAEQERKATARP